MLLIRHWQWCVGALLLFGACVVSAEIRGADIYAEATDQWKRLRRMCNDLTGEFEHTVRILSSNPDKPTLICTGTFVLKGDEGWIRFVDPPAPRSNASDGGERVYGRLKENTFALRKRQGEHEYLLRSFAPSSTDATDFFEGHLRSYAFLPWCAESLDLTRLANDSGFTLISMTRDPERPASVQMNARFVVTGHKGSPGEFSDQVTLEANLDTNRCWTLNSYESSIVRLQNGRTSQFKMKSTIDYRSVDQNPLFIPIRRRSVLSDSAGTEKVVHTVDYKAWNAAQVVEESQIGLSAFGLPEPPSITPQSRPAIPGYLWFIGAAVFCLLVSVVLFRVARSKAARLSASGPAG
jgi:hypothetical protein